MQETAGCRGRFDGKLVVLIGASRGIGRAVARELAREGATLLLNARGESELEAAAAEVAALGAEAEALTGDIRDPAVVQELASTVGGRGRADALILNAGGGTDGKPLEQVSDEEWFRDLELNLTSAFRVSRALVPVMRRQRSGRIVHVSSVAGRGHGNLSGVAYAAAKAGLQGLTRQLAWDLGPFGITVNAVAPGLTRTSRAEVKWEALDPERREGILAGVALRRWGTPDEIARAILFLASDDAAYVTGATLDVNGGLWMC